AAELLDVKEATIDPPAGTDLVFNSIHGTFGEDGQLQAQLDQLGIPYTGAGAESSRLAFDKVASKERFLEAGVPTPESTILPSTTFRAPDDQFFPCVVKPPKEGSSVGVHIVKEGAEWKAAMEDVAKYSGTALVERFIQGKELTVGIFDGEAFPVVHIQPRSGFYDMKNKYPWMSNEGGTDYVCPAELSEEVTRVVQDAALQAHRSLHIEVYSRVDVLLNDEDEKPFVLEVNTIPGMTASSLLPKGAAATGLAFPMLCLRIAEASLALRG
ncbi:MAG: D-alanine--D-alanine ligase, partial [Verrucomicrobiota bacterium]